MKRRSDKGDDKDSLQEKTNGTSEQSKQYQQLQQRLEELELFRALLDNSIDSIFLARLPSGALIDVNESACHRSGYTRGEILGMSLTDLLSPVEARQIQAFLSDHEPAGKDMQITATLFKHNGDSIPVEMTISLVKLRDSDHAVIVMRDITERSQSEEALRESERNYRLLINNATDMVSRHMPDSTIIFTTPSCERMLGYKPGDMVGHPARDFVVPDDRDGLWTAVRTAHKAGQDSYRTEFRMIRRDGSIIWVETLGRFIFNEQGNVEEIHSVVRDITERRQAEDSLKESEDRYRSLFENAIEGIFQTTLDGRIIIANTSLARMLGYDSPREAKEKVIDIGSQVYADPRDREELVERLLRDGKAYGREVMFKRADGSPMKVMLNFLLVRDSGGKPRYIEGSCIDITDRWQAEEALRASEAKYRRLYDNIRDAFVRISMDGTIVECNDAFLAMLGYNAAEIKDCTYKDFTPDKWHTFEDKIVEKEVMTRGYSDIYEKEYRRKDGTVFPVELRAYLLFDDEGTPVGMWAIVRDITERKQAEKELRKSEGKYRDIFENALEGIFQTSKDGGYITANPAMARILGFDSPDELISVDKYTIEQLYVHPGDRLRVVELLEKDERFEGFETELKRKDGRKIWISVNAHTVRDLDDNILYYEGTCEDITDRKRAEEELRESERHLADIIDFLPDATFVINKQGMVTAWNKSMEKMTGIRASDMIGKGNYEYAIPFYGKRRPILIDIALLPSEEIKEEQHYYLRREGSIIIGETALPVVKGEKRTLSGWAQPIYDSSGEIIGAIECVRDITQRKKAEEALAESEARYRLLAENASDIIFSLDTNLRFTYISPSVEKIRGYTAEEAMRQSLEETLTPESLEEAIRVYQEEMEIEAGQSKELWRKRVLELEETCRDGSTVWAETTFTLLRDKQERLTGFLGISRDISERRHAAEERDRLESQLSQAQKMESIGTLAGGIAHDFNNILAAIIGYTELAIEDVSEPAKVKPELIEVLKASDRAKDLVSQILTFSRKTDISYSPLALRIVVKESLKMLRSVIPTTIEIRQDISDSGLVLSDPTQINQIIMNLCTNAAHAMDKAGGVLEVSLKRVSLDQNTAGFFDVIPGNFLKLAISDTGEGMPPEVMERIFEPYFTTKGMGRGTGLGLSVVHGIVKSHKGAITCRSVPGSGTTFEIYLPVIESEITAETATMKEPYPVGTERVMFIDDEATLAAIAEKMLIRLGYKVTIKTSSIEAFESFSNNPHDFDLVITDMTMPSMTGDMIAKRFMEIRPDIPIILCTGYSEYISEENARTLGIREFLLKPLAMGLMARTIRKVLDEK